MCLMLHVAANAPLPARRWPEFAVEPRAGDAPPMPALTLPHVCFVGAPGACSCHFPHVLAAQPIPWYEGMFAPAAERREELAMVERLFELVREGLRSGGRVELWPIWNGDESAAPRGRIEIAAAGVVAERFFLVGRFLHVVH